MFIEHYNKLCYIQFVLKPITEYMAVTTPGSGHGLMLSYLVGNYPGGRLSLIML